MTKRKKLKTWAGNRPAMQDGWRLADFVECDDGQWEVYLRPDLRGSNWVSIKIVACGCVETKANYRLGWSFDEDRFAENRDLPMLQGNCPILFERIRQFVLESVS